MDLAFKLHIISTCALIGLIWIVQIVHYPAFYFVEDKRFVEFESFHKKSITTIVLPLMVTELVTGLVLLYFNRGVIHGINSLSIILIWLSTFFISVPLHDKLSQTKSREDISNLVSTNWIRTSLWSIRGVFIYHYFL